MAGRTRTRRNNKKGACGELMTVEDFKPMLRTLQEVQVDVSRKRTEQAYHKKQRHRPRASANPGKGARLTDKKSSVA